jgi:hypothetical protein
MFPSLAAGRGNLIKFGRTFVGSCRIFIYVFKNTLWGKPLEAIDDEV